MVDGGKSSLCWTGESLDLLRDMNARGLQPTVRDGNLGWCAPRVVVTTSSTRSFFPAVQTESYKEAPTADSPSYHQQG
jgi:hypothetical protein